MRGCPPVTLTLTSSELFSRRLLPMPLTRRKECKTTSSMIRMVQFKNSSKIRTWTGMFWEGALGCPPKFIRIIKKLYTDVHARLIVDGELTQSLEYNSGVKQGCKLAPTLFGIYAAVLLWLAFKKIKHTCSVQIRLPYNGDLFDLRRLKAKTKALTEFIREAQYADDIAIFSDTPEGLQSLLTSYNDVAKRMGLSINTIKTETMCIGNTADFFVDGTKLANITRYVSSDCSMKEEPASRIQAMSCAFDRLRKRVFNSHDLTASTKVAV